MDKIEVDNLREELLALTDEKELMRRVFYIDPVFLAPLCVSHEFMRRVVTACHNNPEYREQLTVELEASLKSKSNE
jgi:hypothetical protein